MTEFASPSPAQDWDARDLGPWAEVPDGWEARLKRWELQAHARDLLDGNRIRVCYRNRLPDAAEVRVYRRPESSTYYRGLMVCGQVWCCPVCAAKIAERRRVELAAAVSLWRKQGGHVLLLTLTVPHSLESEPFALLGGLLAAFRKFSSGKRAWTTLTTGYAGSVRALEVTHGANGWHPHLHVLVFVEGEPDRERLGLLLFERWAACVRKQGLGEASRKAFYLEDERAASRYVTKFGLDDAPKKVKIWGGAEELTKAHIKVARRDGRTPWALLNDHAEGDKQAGALFVQFVHAFKGRSQLQWSRGLRELLGLDVEKTDEQVATDSVKAEDALAALIGAEDWRTIRRYNLQGDVLELLRSSDWAAVELLLDFHRTRGASCHDRGEHATT